MHRGMFAVATALVLTLAACGSDDAARTQAHENDKQYISENIPAVVNTDGSGCDTAKAAGDCWLPLYPRLLLTGTPLNLRETNDSSCTKTRQADCWPQPGAEVKVTCLATSSDGLLWYAIEVPKERVLTPKDGGPAPEAAVTGYAETKWLRLKGQGGHLPSCGLVT